jgi:hypothetical protein
MNAPNQHQEDQHQDDALRLVLRESEGEQFRFTFVDGEELLAKVVSASHVDADGTVVVLRIGAEAGECAWQIHLDDIRSVATLDGHCVYQRVDTGGAG